MTITPAIAIAEGGFNPLDVSASGGMIWTIVIFVVALPLMWKVVFGQIAAALGERDAKASEAIVAAQRASEEAEKSRAAVEVALGEAQVELLFSMADKALFRAKAEKYGPGLLAVIHGKA